VSELRPRALRAAAQRRGFTLFEVLAAVAILALSVTLLARGAIQGMGYEGDASRRLAASLIADQLLFEIESTIAVGSLPEVGRQEGENPGDDEFLRVVEVAPLELAMLGMADLFLPPGEEPGTPRPRGGTPLPELLLVTVRVSWEDGLTEQAVTRTSFAYDASAAAQALAAAGAGAASDSDSNGDGDAENEAEEEVRPDAASRRLGPDRSERRGRRIGNQDR
jgi:prepilin-type N-terminal cleavage/methylation domain-containing protein